MDRRRLKRNVFVQIVIKLGGANSPMVNTQPPPIKEAGYPMNLGHDNVGWVAAGGNIFRLVFEADSRETVVGSPAIGSNRCSRAHSRLDERNEALGGCVLDTRHADTTGAPTPDFGGNRDNRFLVCFPPRNANLPRRPHRFRRPRPRQLALCPRTMARRSLWRSKPFDNRPGRVFVEPQAH